MAGALGLTLGGPRAYAGTSVDGAFLGEGRLDASPRDIVAALRLYWTACAMQGFALVGLALAI